MTNNNQYQGASYYKCALQVNPFSYASDFRGAQEQNEENYNEQILEQCQKNNIKVVGLADHSKVKNSQSLQKLLTKNGIIVFPDLRKSKNNRQYIFATHNANIPVFGDAELIVVLSSKNDKGKIANQGSIDKDTIQSYAADILEGGENAFNTRKKKYGFN